MEAALSLRPDLVQAQRALRNADLLESFARNQKLPTLQLYGNMSLSSLADDLSSSSSAMAEGQGYGWEVGMLLEAPLPDRSARADYRAARIRRLQAGARAADLLEAATREVADAIADLRTAAARMTSARQARELARRLLSAEEKSYNLGRTESFNVLDAQAALAASERDEVRARTDYATALANLYRVRGDLLQARNIVFLPRQ